MKKIDESQLDGALLRLFLTVLSEGSVTRAADRLGVTQSSVSHSLKRLSAIAGEPLFAPAGRTIAPTPRALDLAPLAERILGDLTAFAAPTHFEPAEAELNLVVAANDLQRELLLPELFRRASRALGRFEMRVITARSPGPELLRERHCDLIITPRPPDASDVLQKRLLVDRYVCFYDASARGRPASEEDYLAARHASVVYSDGVGLQFDEVLSRAGVRRDVVVAAPHFSALASFLRGDDLLATLPSLLSRSAMAGFASAPIPLPTRTMAKLAALPLYMVWHQRSQLDEAHRWVRDQIEQIADDARD